MVTTTRWWRSRIPTVTTFCIAAGRGKTTMGKKRDGEERRRLHGEKRQESGRRDRDNNGARMIVNPNCMTPTLYLFSVLKHMVKN